ncbi:hypothetical protein JHK85_024750 [Glycine max]|nr:hypothetical protein JHK85_024750 [Glycine max]
MLDVKPWDDETDMKKLEEAVRSIEMEGLLFGAFFDSFTIMFALLSRFFFFAILILVFICVVAKLVPVRIYNRGTWRSRQPEELQILESVF